MEKIIEKLEIYQFINYIFPGVIFGTIFTKIIGENFLDNNIVIAIIEYYFIGLVLSRIGSVLIKPMLEKLKVVNFEQYEEFVKCGKKDDKVDLLQREANQYRTYIATFICLSVVEAYLCITNKTFYEIILLFIALVIIFILSYKKQTDFVIKRINAVSNED